MCVYYWQGWKSTLQVKFLGRNPRTIWGTDLATLPRVRSRKLSGSYQNQRPPSHFWLPAHPSQPQSLPTRVDPTQLPSSTGGKHLAPGPLSCCLRKARLLLASQGGAHSYSSTLSMQTALVLICPFWGSLF